LNFSITHPKETTMMPVLPTVQRRVRTAAAVALMAAIAPSMALAADLSGTLKKVKDDGIVVVGFREASIPFSYYNDAKQPIGYSIDFTNLILDGIRKQVNAPDL